MNTITRIIKRRSPKTSFLCFAAIAALLLTCSVNTAYALKHTAKTKTRENSFMNPDFAFPKTVEKNAVMQLDVSLAKKEYDNALLAAIQIDIANFLISETSMKESAERFDSLSKILPSPWSNLSLLLEAQIYSEFYSSRPYLFDRRTVPASPVPDNVMEWSTKIFADKTKDLVSKALDDSSLSSIPLIDINKILTSAEDAEKRGFSVLDFMALKAAELLLPFSNSPNRNIIPFGIKNPSATSGSINDYIDDILDRAIARHADDADKFIESFFCNLKMQRLNAKQKSQYAEACIERFYDSPYCGKFLLQLVNTNFLSIIDNETRKKNLELISEYLKRFPKAEDKYYLEESANFLTRKSVSIKFNNRLLPNRENRITATVANLYDFYVLVYTVPMSDENYSLADIKSIGKLMHKVPVKAEGTIPDKLDVQITLPALAPGQYVFVVSEDGSISKDILEYNGGNLSSACVSDITSIEMTNETDSADEIYVISAIDGRPVEGAEVNLYKRDKNYRYALSETLTTDAYGKVSFSKGNYRYRASFKGNVVTGSVYSYNSDKEVMQKRGALMTDLSIYKPGQEVRFSGVVYSSFEKSLTALADREVRVMLKDVVSKDVDSLTLKTDKFGRYEGSFIMPETGMLGSWNLMAVCEDTWVARTYFEVAEYKTPTFEVEVNSPQSSFDAGETIKFTGFAKTYSGMPVIGANVKFTVEYTPFFFLFRDVNNASYSGETTTNADGTFEIELPTEGLTGTDFALAAFTLKADVTDGAGETQAANPVRFSVGEAYEIRASIPDKILASETGKYDVEVVDMVGKQVDKTVYYRLYAGEEIIHSGEFISPHFPLNPEELKSGKYSVKFSLDSSFESGELNQVVERDFAVWRKTDTVPALQSIIWVDSNEITAAEGERSVRFRVGTSYEDTHILVKTVSSKRNIETGWINISNGFADITAVAPQENERIFVYLFSCRDLENCREMITITPRLQKEHLKATVVTFRENITPGQKETWKFRFTFDGKDQSDIPVMAVLSNKALNALAPFRWNFNPYSSLYWNPVSSVDMVSVSGQNNFYNWKQKSIKNSEQSFSYPTWQTYGYNLAVGAVYVIDFSSAGMMPRKNAMPSRSMPLFKSLTSMDIEAEDMAVEESASISMATSDVSEAGGIGQTEESPLRDIEQPLAFFLPSLTTDGEGVTTIDFEAPAFVGTWQLQVLGYTPDMRGTVLCMDAVSSKKVMVQLNSPQFVRTGDMLDVQATLFNNSGAPQTVTGRIEFVNPFDGTVLASCPSESLALEDSGSCVIGASLRIPSDLDALAIRAYAEIPGYSDGEQSVIAVLPATTPIIESTPFYIAPADKVFKISLPKFSDDAKVTMTYCDNPVWECVAALPDMLKPESVNIQAQIYALFGNCVSKGLLEKYPEILEGLRQMDDEAALNSPLERNPELKTVLLDNTPWVNDARSENLRMRGLLQFADINKSDEAVNSLVERITQRQNADGGWGWCPDMSSSEFITLCVFSVLADLQNMGYLPVEMLECAVKASRYLERLYVENWQKSKYKYYPQASMLRYLLGKSAFPDVPSTSEFSKLRNLALKDARTEWRKADVGEKAVIAIVLQRNGYPADARIILESLAEYASESPEKGVWYDNLTREYNPMNTLLSTSRVLEAFAAIDPSNPIVDKIRQWLIVSKQAADWGGNRYTAEVINALLTSGTKWTASAGCPVVKLDGCEIAIPNPDNKIGSFTINLDAEAASGAQLEFIRRGDGPAWGGVVSQFTMPITEVKEASIPELSIRKEVSAVSPTADGIAASGDNPQVGDKVKVTLTVVCDMDLDYVAITDPRAACLQPVEQLSGYERNDGLWMYREVRSNVTNLFITTLPKGTYVFSYDCYVDRTGEYSLGVATAQSQYAPTITAHSGGRELEIGK